MSSPSCSRSPCSPALRVMVQPRPPGPACGAGWALGPLLPSLGWLLGWGLWVAGEGLLRSYQPLGCAGGDKEMTVLEEVRGLKITDWAAARPPGPAGLCWSPVLPQPRLGLSPRAWGLSRGRCSTAPRPAAAPAWGRTLACPLALLRWSWPCPAVEASTGWVLWWVAGRGPSG